MQRRSTLLLPFGLAVSLLMVGSCAIPLTDLDEAETQVPIRVTAFAVGTPVSTLVVEVTATDIKQKLVFNLQVVDGVATGTIEVPAGEARTFNVTAYDDHHNVTHTGSETTDVNPGSNPPLKVKLKPVAGEVDVEVTFGDYGVVVTPSAVAFTALGETEELVATVFDQYDEEVPDAEVVWATTHPTIVSVSESGLVTALAEGQATIVATYAGVAGVCEVTVNDLVGEEVCDGVDNNADGQIDEGLMYCIGGAPAPNTDGENSCLPGWLDSNADPLDGCEAQSDPLEPNDTYLEATDLGTLTPGNEVVITANIVPGTDDDWFRLILDEGGTDYCGPLPNPPDPWYGPAVSITPQVASGTWYDVYKGGVTPQDLLRLGATGNTTSLLPGTCGGQDLYEIWLHVYAEFPPSQPSDDYVFVVTHVAPELDITVTNPRASNYRTAPNCTGNAPICFDFTVFISSSFAGSTELLHLPEIGPCPSSVSDQNVFSWDTNSDFEDTAHVMDPVSSVTICTWADPRGLQPEAEENNNKLEFDVTLPDLVITRVEYVP